MLRATGDESSQKIAQKIQQLSQAANTELQNTFRSIIAERSAQIEPLAFIMKNQPLPAFSRDEVRQLSDLARFASEETQIEGLQHSILDNFVSIRSAYIQKSLYTFVLASQRNLEIRTNTLYDRENNGIGHYTEALSRMSQNEKSLCTVIFGETEGTDIHNRVINAAFADYAVACKAISAHVRSRMLTDCYLGFETLEHILKLNKHITDIDMPEVAREIHTNLSILAGYSTSAFSEVAEDLKRKTSGLTALPPDANVVDIIKELCMRLKRFLDYPHVISQLFQAVGESDWRRSSSSPIRIQNGQSEIGLAHFDGYSAELVDNVLQLLEQKTRSLHRRLNVVGIFMLNNSTYLQTAIVRSDMSKYLSEKTLKKVEECNKRALRIYRESWDSSARQLMDTTIMRPADAKTARNSLTSKDRDAVKERFKMFNTEFDESIRACKTLNVIDGELRQSLTNEIRSIIVPLYSRFYDKYVNTDFTKNKEKYIKYSKEGLEKAIWDSFA